MPFKKNFFFASLDLNATSKSKITKIKKKKDEKLIFFISVFKFIASKQANQIRMNMR